uniref:Ig-like domain-containing protein n=1 Tax=Myotis lucifugus TaxID=59463 RepID=G1PYU2_MYOLU
MTQEASLSGSPGQKVTLSCKGNSNNVGARTVGWYQQVTGSAPKTVMFGSSRPSGIPERFSGSQSGNTASLVITGLQPEDEAVYYCSTWDTSISNHTLLPTHGELRQKPALFPLIALN